MIFGYLFSEAMQRDDWSESSELIKGLTGYLLAATMSGIEVTCSILDTLLSRLKDAVKQCDALVPDSVYLPAPPVYCPQPVITAEVS